MKRLLVLISFICIVIASMQICVTADAFDLFDVTRDIKSNMTGKADNNDAAELRVEDFEKAIDNHEINGDGTIEDFSTALSSLYEKNDVLESLDSAPLKVATKAISYYSGTSIPTYTYVTGWSLYFSSALDNGGTAYYYHLNSDDQMFYMEYLMDYYGWVFYDYIVADDDSYIMAFLVKNGDMLTIVSDFELNCTVIMTPEVANVAPTSISLNITSRTMIVGNMYTLKPTIYPSNATNKTVTWSSSNSAVASVDSEGFVKALKAGTATITAKTSNGKKATCSITVKPLELKYYTDTNIPTYTSVTGKTSFHSTNNDGTMIYFYDLDYESQTDYEAFLVARDGWELLDEEISETDRTISALFGKGDVTVFTMADFNEEYTAIAFDYVENIRVTGVTLNQTTARLKVGDVLTLNATVKPSNATNTNVTWSSSNTSVATVSANGEVTAHAIGTAKITVKTEDGAKVATCTVTVEATPVTSVTLNTNFLGLTVGDVYTFVATVLPTDATNKNVRWTTSNSSVATVENGVVTAKSAGKVTITVTTVDGSKKASCAITVSKKVIPVTSIVLDKVNVELMVGESETLTATVAPEDATDKSVTWSSNNTSVVTVSTSGKVTAVGEGIATITAASSNEITDVCVVTVIKKQTKLVANDVFVSLGNTFTVPVEIMYNDGLAGLGLTIEYDNVFELVSIEKGDALGSLSFVASGDLTSNPINANWDGMDADNSNGKILTLTFKAKEDVLIGDYSIAINAKTAYDNNTNDVEVVGVRVGVEVVDFVPGDINGDTEVDLKDVTVLRRYLAGGYDVVVQQVALDVNRDGNVDLKDITHLRRALAGGYGVELN